jgi:hypothetical protein
MKVSGFIRFLSDFFPEFWRGFEIEDFVIWESWKEAFTRFEEESLN